MKTLHVLSIIIKSKESRLGSSRDTRITYTQIKTSGSFPGQIIPNLSFCLSEHSYTNVCFLQTWYRNPHSQVPTLKLKETVSKPIPAWQKIIPKTSKQAALVTGYLQS